MGRTRTWAVLSFREFAVKRVIAFLLVFIVIGALIGGISWFQFVFKPQMIKGFISKMAPPPSAVSVAEAV